MVTKTQPTFPEKVEAERRRLAEKHSLPIGSITTDYVAGRLEYEERTGPLRTRLSNQIKINAGLVVVLLILSTGLVVSRQKNHLIPYVAVLDTDGHLLGVGTHAKAADPSFESGAKVDLLKRWLTQVRTVITEWDTMRPMIESTLNRTSDEPGGAHTFLKNWYTQTRPDQQARDGNTTSVVLNNPLQLGPNTYELEWTETQQSHGQVVGTSRWKGMFRVAMRPPASLDDGNDNPLGFAVTEIHWSKLQ